MSESVSQTEAGSERPVRRSADATDSPPAQDGKIALDEFVRFCVRSQWPRYSLSLVACERVIVYPRLVHLLYLDYALCAVLQRFSNLISTICVVKVCSENHFVAVLELNSMKI